MTDITQDMPVAVEPPPAASLGPVGWARTNLFGSIPSAIVTLIALYVILAGGFKAVRWLILNATFSAPVGRACNPDGACWAFIAEKIRFILFGRFPYDQQWRPLLVVIVFIAMIVTSCDRRLWGRSLGLIWFGGLALVGLLMWGGVLGMSFVETSLWNGLPLTLILAVVGIIFAFPLAILLALGRRSTLPAVRAICIAYIELIRGVPLITILFMASVMLPLFFPEGVTIDKLLRAQIAFILFSAAYLAENVRAGLQAIPKGQFEAADTLGLSFSQRTRLIILPQALNLVIAPLVNTFIGMFKDTSLVIVIGLFDLLGTANASLTDPNWRGFFVEAYLFVAAIYFAFCFFMSRYSQVLEREFNKGRRR